MSLHILVLLALVLLIAGTANAKIYAWGVNDYGQLGLNGTVFRFPQSIPSYNDVDIVQLVASGTYHVAVTGSGDVYVSGNNWYGACAFPTSSGIFVGYPTKNPSLYGCKVYAGKRHGNAVCGEGQRFVGWGLQSGYVEGLSEGIFGRVTESLPQYELRPKVVDVISGARETFISLNNGTVYVAGNGDRGILGLGDKKDRPYFVRFDGFDGLPRPLLKIFPSHADHVCAIDTDYSLFCWGSNSVGQLGIGNFIDQSRPKLVSFFENHFYVVQVSVGLYHTLALTAGGRVFAWGQAQNGVLGNSRADNVSFTTPIEIEFLADKGVVEIVSGLNFNFVRTSNNQWYSWGAGSGGVLGTKNDFDISRPTIVAFLSAFNITQILTAATSRSVYGWLDASAATTISGPPLAKVCGTPAAPPCTANAHCQNTDKSAICVCNAGFSGDGNNCQDINECSVSGFCDPSATCTNLPGSYSCSCPTNLPIGDGKTPLGTGCKAPPPPPISTTTTTTATTATTATASTTKAATSSGSASGAPGGTSQQGGSSTSAASVATTKASATGSNDGVIVVNTATTTTEESTSGSGSTSGAAAASTNAGATTAGNNAATSSSTTQTNLYHTLFGAQELQVHPPSSSTTLNDGSALILTKSNNADSNRDKKIFVGVIITVGFLIIIAAVAGIYFIFLR